MTPEQVADRLLESIEEWDETTSVFEPDDDLRTDGGVFIDATIGGVEFTITVTRSRS